MDISRVAHEEQKFDNPIRQSVSLQLLKANQPSHNRAASNPPPSKQPKQPPKQIKSKVSPLFEGENSPWEQKKLKERIEKIAFQQLASWFIDRDETIQLDFYLRKKILYIHSIKRPIPSDLSQILENGGFLEVMGSSDNPYEKQMADQAYQNHHACFYLQSKESIKNLLIAIGEDKEIFNELFRN